VKLFINYRREDTAPYAGRLYDRLSVHFGADQVFIDIDQIEPGEDFVEVINRKVGACEIAIVSIGPNWLSVTDASGKHRLDDEEDFVRMEIIAALERKIRVIPVLVGGARMPRREDLPEALAPLSRRNAIELSETRFHADVNRLIEAIEKARASPEQKAVPSVAATLAEPAAGNSKSKDLRDASEPPEASKFSVAAFATMPKPASAKLGQRLTERSDIAGYMAKVMTGGPIALRYKVGFYVAAWILAFVASIPAGHPILFNWYGFPAWVIAAMLRASIYLSGKEALVLWVPFFIHAVILFRARSRRMTLILFAILFGALVCEVAAAYYCVWRIGVWRIKLT
jgi:hypothetical protein